MARRLLLFIDQRHPIGAVAISAAQQLLSNSGSEPVELEIKDVAQEPDDAETHQIFATPTLLRTDVDPPLRVVGDLADTERVATALQLR